MARIEGDPALEEIKKIGGYQSEYTRCKKRQGQFGLFVELCQEQGFRGNGKGGDKYSHEKSHSEHKDNPFTLGLFYAEDFIKQVF